MLIYISERSTCRYVWLNTLKVLHVHGPCFKAPNYNDNLKHFRTTVSIIKFSPKCFYFVFQTTYQNISDCNYTFEEDQFDEVSFSAKDFISRLLVVDQVVKYKNL